MASVIRHRTIQYTDREGRRRTLSLGRLNLDQRHFARVLLHVDSLVASQLSGHAVAPETARWLGEIGEPLTERLARAGLISPRSNARLGSFIEEYIAGRCDLKASTRGVLRQTRSSLVAFFGEGKPLREITSGDADLWRLSLVSQELASSTIGRRVKTARQFLTAAQRRSLVDQNPFADLKSTAIYDSSKFRFVTREESARILEACPDAEWRLLFALCRFGGLRCPSEIFVLRWGDIHWDCRRILVHSPKTEHHEGGESRWIPMFPELEPRLLEVFAGDGPGEPVIRRISAHSGTLRRCFGQIIRQAGLDPWPKPFVNLRSTRETELAEIWPEHVVVAWIGNTVTVARKHYLQTTEKHFEEAASGAREKAEALHEALQQAPASDCQAAQADLSDPGESALCGPPQPVADVCGPSGPVRNVLVGFAHGG